MDYRPEIDGLRAVAVLSVVIAHAGFDTFAGGYVGVDIFFVISGYLILSVILNDLNAGVFSFRRFYAKRARRILPALMLVVAACFPVAVLIMSPSEFVDFALGAAAAMLFVANIYFWDIAGYFSADAKTQPLLHTWSLSIEEQYYLLFPFLIVPVWRYLGARVAITLLAVMAALSLGLADWGARNKPVENYFFPFSRFWELLVGAVLAGMQFGRPRWRNDSLALLGLAMITAAILLYDEATPFPSAATLLPVVGAALVLGFADQAGIAGRILSLRPMIWIGLISYSLYLWHQPVFAFARLAGVEDTATLIALPLIGLMVLLSWASWRWVEQPFRTPEQQYGLSRRGVTLLALTVAVVLTGAGILGGTTRAIVYAYPAADRPLVETTRRAARSYLSEWPDQFINRPFSEDGRRKVLIVGDSFAKDILNGLKETGVAQHLDLSLSIVGSDCGNLFLDRAGMASLADKRAVHCEPDAPYTRPFLSAQLQKADTVALISRWEPFVVDALPTTLRNLSSATRAEVFVMGRKGFPVVDLAAFRSLPPSARPDLRLGIDPHVSAVNASLRDLSLANFIDVQGALCDGPAACPIISPAGTLLSVDEGHATQDGARLLVDRLLEKSAAFRALISANGV